MHISEELLAALTPTGKTTYQSRSKYTRVECLGGQYYVNQEGRNHSVSFTPSSSWYKDMAKRLGITRKQLAINLAEEFEKLYEFLGAYRGSRFDKYHVIYLPIPPK
jgi:hypothetical protein